MPVPEILRHPPQLQISQPANLAHRLAQRIRIIPSTPLRIAPQRQRPQPRLSRQRLMKAPPLPHHIPFHLQRMQARRAALLQQRRDERRRRRKAVELELAQPVACAQPRLEGGEVGWVRALEIGRARRVFEDELCERGAWREERQVWAGVGFDGEPEVGEGWGVVAGEGGEGEV